MPDPLTPEELKSVLDDLADWELDGRLIERTFEFDDFSGAIDFVVAVAEIAEEEDHHPDIDIRWNKVTLRLSTHSAGGLTKLDVVVAGRIDSLEEAE